MGVDHFFDEVKFDVISGLEFGEVSAANFVVVGDGGNEIRFHGRSGWRDGGAGTGIGEPRGGGSFSAFFSRHFSVLRI
ncbi:MAG: hypothetical protein JO022_14465 [Acidobacteriaceae bacterium]|nr:hypothetical protein [Acidobacteriaceae bacterium]